MAGSVDVALRLSAAVVYALAGALVGAAVAFGTIKVVLLVLGAAVLSAKAVQVIVVATSVLAALAAAIGYVRQR